MIRVLRGRKWPTVIHEPDLATGLLLFSRGNVWIARETDSSSRRPLGAHSHFCGTNL